MPKKIIYAEDAIKAVHDLYAIFGSEGEWVDRKDVFEAIDSLPSAQPEQLKMVQDILQYLDEYLHPIVSPEHWSVYSVLYDMVSVLSSAQPEKRTEERTETHACDLISRQDAIDALAEWYEGLICGSFKGLEKRLRALPSAQPENIARDIATIIENEKDMRVVLKNAEPQWIPVTERMPEETDSIFARYYGTERWSNSMFRKRSKEVIVTTRFKDGTLHTETAHTNDGKWWFDIKGIQRDVIAWCEMPEPWRGEKDG